jgi:hypothetical protein
VAGQPGPPVQPLAGCIRVMRAHRPGPPARRGMDRMIT